LQGAEPEPIDPREVPPVEGDDGIAAAGYSGLEDKAP